MHANLVAMKLLGKQKFLDCKYYLVKTDCSIYRSVETVLNKRPSDFNKSWNGNWSDFRMGLLTIVH